MIATTVLSLEVFVEVSGDGRGDQADELVGEAVRYTKPLAWRDRFLRASTHQLEFLPD
jgi:hypothetical protein